MTEFAGLRELARLLQRIEPNLAGGSLSILAHENKDEIAKQLLDGFGVSLPVQHSSGEYANHLAILRAGGNKYTFAQDWREVYISEINYCACRIPAGAHGLLVHHVDYPGVIYDVSRKLAEHEINISKLNVSREQKGKNALLVSVTDEEITPAVVSAIEELPQITKVVSLQ
ncbi:ACT domain-containing protein [Brevibacillus nitrificans]|uniref:ACT domain-containing protein n=1 Tax=Brevibacillus nitrificans TaxID=651560 RepID=UPI0028602334|nr:ACT domain-containing protein [Brevibacillus nitrificans]MDR7316322.1 L-serine dehydratase [Brevibacillus nitrificans]